MPKNPFTTLEVSENVTQNELFDAYRELRNEYSKKRFELGDAGAEACAKLEEIEAAYAEATDILRSRFEMSEYGDSLSGAEDTIEDNEYAEAKEALCQEMPDGSRSYKNSGKRKRSYQTATPEGKAGGCTPCGFCAAECCCECLCESCCESFSSC